MKRSSVIHFSFLRCVFLLALWVVCVSLPMPAYGLGVTPTRFVLTAKPGEEITRAMQLSNLTNETVHIKGTLLDFQQRDGEMIVGEGGYTPDSCLTWVRFTPKELTLSPWDATFLRFTVSVPPGVEGEYRTVLRLEELPQIPPDRSGMLLGIRMNVPIYMRIAGTEAPLCDITKVDVHVADVPRALRFDYPLWVDITVENTGNVHLRPNGNLTIREVATGNIVYNEPLQNDNPVFPGNKITLTAGLSEWRLFLAGEYEALISIFYFDRQYEIRGTKTFTIEPSGEVLQ